MIFFHILYKYLFAFIFKKYSFCTYFELDNFVSFFLVKAHKIIFRLHTTWIHLCSLPKPQKILSVGIYLTVVLHMCEMMCVWLFRAKLFVIKKGLNSIVWADYGVQAQNVILHNSEKWRHTLYSDMKRAMWRTVQWINHGSGRCV